MKFLILCLFISSAWATNPVEKSDLNPVLEEPVVPGTKVPVENMNTAPTEPEIQKEEQEFRDTLEARKAKEKQLENENLIQTKRMKP
jgi:hypothetical protein